MSTLSPLLLAAVKALVLLGATAALALALRQRPARLRAVLWGTALTGSLLIPMVTPLLPALSVPVPEAVARWASPPQQTVATVAALEPFEAPFHEPTAHSLKRSTIAPTPSQPPTIDWIAVTFGLWALGAAVLLARLGRGLWRVDRLVRIAEPVTDPAWQRLLDAASLTTGCRRRVRLLTSAEVEVPATVGLFRPAIVLPPASQSWLPDRRHAVLLHELVHIARLDWPLRVTARLARAVYWFNPLVWWAVRRLDLEQELASDEEVLALGTRASSYACHLLGIARHAVPCPAPAIPALGMARRTHLEERIMTMLERTNHRRVGLAVLIPAALAMAAMVPAIAAVAPSDPEPRAAGPELREVLEEFEAIEEKMEPHIAGIEAIEIEMEPALEAIEDIEIDIDHEKLAEIEARMEPYLARLEDIEIDMAPFEARMAELERQLDEMEIHIEDGTLVQVQEQIATQIAAHMEQFEQVHVDMEPYLAHIEKLHEQLEPLHEEMAQIHVDMEPFHREMKKFEVEMEGFERQMEKFHEQMEPLHREMERLQERLDEAVQRELEAYLRDRLGAVAAPGTDFSEGAARIADDARIEIDDGVLELRPRRTDVREVLDDLYGPQRIGTRDAFDAAVDDAAAGLDPLRISID